MVSFAYSHTQTQGAGQSKEEELIYELVKSKLLES